HNAVEAGPDWWLSNPNGSGPFRFFAYQPGFGLLLARNDSFYREPAYVEGVVFDLRGGSWLDRYAADVIDFQPSIFADDVDAVFDQNGPYWNDLVRDASGNPGVVQMSVNYVGFNAHQPPFDDPLVRQAFSRSVDKQLLNETIFRNLSVVAEGILPPSMPGFNRSLRGLDFNPAQARQLLAQSRYAGKLPPVKITVAGVGGPVGGLVGGLVDQWQRNLGVTVEVEQVDWESFLADTRAGRTQMFQLGWSADYPDPSDFLDVLFHSGSGENHTGYSNPEVDRLLEAARGERNVQTRLRLYQQAEQIVVRDAAWLPLSFGRDYPLVKPWVHGLTFSGMDIPYLRFVWLDQ
ncbi:MAG TPA: ABC transporter substrate-binding protein, partial [Planctomycetaceae bacterium]